MKTTEEEKPNLIGGGGGAEIKNLSIDIPLTPCQNFRILQKSNTHQAPATGTTNNFLQSVESRIFKANNSIKGISVDVTSELLKPSSLDELCNMFIWDRAGDSKYYRNINTPPSTVGSVIESKMSVKWLKL